MKNRRRIRPDLEINDGILSDGRFDLLPVAFSEPKVVGEIFIPAKKADLYLWVDSGIFSGELSNKTSIKFRVSHRGCRTVVYMKSHIDRPNIPFNCASSHFLGAEVGGWAHSNCMKAWELYQLEALTPKGFSETFEYIVTPAGQWPNKIVTINNGVTKYGSVQRSTRDQAAEYFAAEFNDFRSNGFKKRQQ